MGVESMSFWEKSRNKQNMNTPNVKNNVQLW